MLVAKDETEPQVMINRLVAFRRRYVMEVNTDTAKVMRISRQPSQIQIMIDKKQPKNVEYFNSLGSLITSDATCTCEIRSRIAIAKVIFYKKKTLFRSKLNLNFEKETSEITLGA
jgi:hypothetical protein